jgi:Flp pilus assembly protein TadB
LRAPMARYVRLANRIGQGAALEAVRFELADPVSDPIILTFEMAVAEGTEQVLRILTDLTSQIEGDLQLADRITTLQTQSRIATWAVFAVPYALLVFLCATQSFYRSFFSEPVGLAVMFCGIGLSVTGLWIARRLGRSIPTTQRVFAVGRQTV